MSREIWMFLGLATIPILYLFHEAITQGSVLGQATLLYQYVPWSAHTPGEIRANNRLLWDVPTLLYPVLQHPPPARFPQPQIHRHAGRS